MAMRIFEFRENRSSANHTLRSVDTYTDFCLYLLHFLTDLAEIWYMGSVHNDDEHS